MQALYRYICFMDYLFVYGTLLSAYGHPIHQVIAQNGQLLSMGFYQGKLYRVSYYPAVVSSSEAHHQVKGEVYQIHNAEPLFDALDDYEGYWPHNEAVSDYLRRKVSITLTDGTIIEAWTYLYNLPIDGLEWIVSGDFLGEE